MTTARWITPKYSRGQIDRAGDVLRDSRSSVFQIQEAYEVLNNWRSSHNFPLNSLQMLLRKNATRAEETALVVQRLKRVSSILLKLKRFPSMKMSRMQDIGGCRAVVSSVEKVKAVRESFMHGRARHILSLQKDYISNPKPSGYRGIHLIYRYKSDSNPEFNDLQIEIQIRTYPQHAWATAVETVGTFLDQALKSSEGSERWLQFFAYTGSAFAALEKSPLVPSVPVGEALTKGITAEASKLKVVEKLSAYGTALKIIEDRHQADAHYYLLALRPAEHRLDIKPFRADQLDQASHEYMGIERGIETESGAQAVLVRADSVEALRKAYPNYFLDTKVFIAFLNKITGVRAKRGRGN